MVAERVAAEALSAIPLDAEALARIEAEQASDVSGSECEAVGCVGSTPAPEGLGTLTPDGAEAAAPPGTPSGRESANGCAGQGLEDETLPRAPEAPTAAAPEARPANGCAVALAGAT
jgi:hypothetical protein